jgi:hypothetical protein
VGVDVRTDARPGRLVHPSPASRAAPTVDPAVLLPEERRFCPACHGRVGRGRGGRAGRLQGTCPWCRCPFDLRPDLAPGTVLSGRRRAWRITGPARRGGHAWLHHAVAADGTPALAIRVVGPDGDEAGTIAAHEPEVLLALDHPGLAPVLDAVDHPDGRRHLLVAPIPGAAPPPPVGAARAAAVVRAVLPAVAHLHAAGLLHADLKPEHLVQRPDGGVVLVDLGSLRRTDDRTGPVWGTELFLAPELVPGASGPSPASDVWALGRTLAVLAEGAPAPGRPVRPVTDPALARVVAAATDPDPAARPSPRVLADALAPLAVAAVDPDGVAPPPAVATQRVPDRPDRARGARPGDDGVGVHGDDVGVDHDVGVVPGRGTSRPARNDGGGHGDDHARGATIT